MQNTLSHKPIFPLPLRVIPLPWEDLQSLIVRTATEMHYRNPRWVVQPQEVEDQITTYDLCLLWKETDYHILQGLLRLDEETLYQRTYHSFASRLRSIDSQEEGTQKHEEGIRRHLLEFDSINMSFRPYSATRICPYCIDAEIPYGRLYWNFRALAICPLHNTLLIDRCPSCCKSIPSMRSSITHCPHCKAGDYRRARSMPLNDCPFFYLGQKLIWHHLTGLDLEQNGDIILLGDLALLKDSPLLDIPSQEYFQLLRVFLKIVPILFPHDSFLQVDQEIRQHLRSKDKIHDFLTPSEWIALTTAFHYTFASWPNHFFAFLDALVRNRKKEGTIGYESYDFGNLGRRIYRDLSEPAFFFLREAYENYLKTHYIGHSRIPTQERYSLTIKRAAETLGIFQSEIDAFINIGSLRVAQEPIKVKNKTMKRRIERTSVERLCQEEWKTLVTFYKVAYSLFGVREDTMHILYKKGWVLPVRGPGIDSYPIEMYSLIDVNTFITRLLSRAVNGLYIAGESISLSAIFTSNLTPTESILDAIFDGKLVLINTNTSAPLFQRLMLSHTQIYYWQDTQKVSSEGQVFLTREEAADILGIRKHVITHLVTNGLLTEEVGQDLQHSLFIWDKVETFRQTYVFLREAAALLNVLPAIIYNYIKEGKICSVLANNDMNHRRILLFRREDIRSLLLS